MNDDPLYKSFKEVVVKLMQHGALFRKMYQRRGLRNLRNITGDRIFQRLDLIPEGVRLREQLVRLLTVEHRVDDSLRHELGEHFPLFGVLRQQGLNLLNPAE